MNDLEREIRETLHRHEYDAPPFDPSDAGRALGRTRRRQILNVAALGIGSAALVVGVVAGLGGLVRADRGPTVLKPPPSVATPVWSPIRERGTSVVSGRAWRDPNDVSVDWVEVRRVRADSYNAGAWRIKLAANPPRATGPEPGLLIAYGLVFDTTDDGVADYLIGIDDATGRAGFRVWVTDLATGETDEKIGAPYGFPIEFRYPNERYPHMTFTFLPGSEPADLNPETVRFYAWASMTRDGELIAADLAPDMGWMSRT